MLTACIYVALPHPTFEPRLQSTNGPHRCTQRPQKPLFQRQTSCSSTGTHGGSLRGLDPSGRISAKHLSQNIHPLLPITPNITSSTPPSVSSESPSFTLFFARFYPIADTPAQLLTRPKLLIAKLLIPLLVKFPETFIVHIFRDSVSVTSYGHFFDSSSAREKFLRT